MPKLPKPFPEKPPPGPFQKDFWKSPLRGPWLTSFLGSALLPLILICALTGFLSHVAYYPDLGENSVTGSGGVNFDLYFFDWPSSPAWLYAFTQGLHIISGLAATPILLAKLWSAMPKFFEWPPVRSLAHMLDRLSLALLVGGSLFVFFTGVFNIQLWYPFGFSFVPAHYYGAFIFLAALGLHLVGKIPVARRAFREKGVIKPLRDDLNNTKPEAFQEDTSTPRSPQGADDLAPGTPGRGGRGLARPGPDGGGPGSRRAIPEPGLPVSARSRLRLGRQRVQVNRTAMEAAINPVSTTSELAPHPRWRRATVELSREELLAMEQYTESLPIACVEGWTTTQDWTGVRITRPCGAGRHRRSSAGHVQSLRGGRQLQPGDARRQPGVERALAPRAEGERRRPLARPWLSGASHRPGAAWGPLHQMGLLDDLQGGLRWRGSARAMGPARCT